MERFKIKEVTYGLMETYDEISTRVVKLINVHPEIILKKNLQNKNWLTNL